jgi:hypothetical protein
VDVISYNFPHSLHEKVEIVLKSVIIAAFPICHSVSVYVMYHKPVQLLGDSKNHQTKTSRNRYHSLHHMQTDSGAQPATGYEVDDWVLIPSRKRNFSFHHHVLIDSGAQPLTDHKVDDWGLIPSRDRNFFIHLHMQTSSGVHPVTVYDVDDYNLIPQQGQEFFLSPSYAYKFWSSANY